MCGCNLLWITQAYAWRWNIITNTMFKPSILTFTSICPIKNLKMLQNIIIV